MKEHEKYNARRDEALHAQRRRQNDAITRSETLRALLETRTQLHVRRGLALATGEDAAAIEAQLLSTSTAITEELLRLGYSADHLDLQPICSICNDTGYANGERCTCLEERRPLTTLADYRLDCFPAGPQRERAQKLYEYICGFTATYPACDKMNILLSGGTGLGKTFALSCVAGELQQRGVRTELFTAYEFILSIMDDVLKKGDYSLLGRLRRVPVLVLDDLGTEPLIPNITHEYMFNLIDSRYSRGLCTLIATNLTAGAMQERYGERTCSRLFDRARTRTIRLEGVDLRTGKC